MRRGLNWRFDIWLSSSKVVVGNRSWTVFDEVETLRKGLFPPETIGAGVTPSIAPPHWMWEERIETPHQRRPVPF